MSNLISQPIIDWSKAPSWANYFTIDKDRMAFWHENKPELGFTFWNSYGQKASIGFVKGIYDWEKSLQQRQKIETLTISLNTDISGYLSGKNSFITGLVDLLLARMAKEERFSDEIACEKSQAVKLHDVITFKFDNDFGFAIVTQVLDGYVYVNYIAQNHNDEWIPQNCFGIAPDYTVIRRINELEAVEFRKAMEAVYG